MQGELSIPIDVPECRGDLIFLGDGLRAVCAAINNYRLQHAHMLQLRRKIAGFLLSGAFLLAALWLAPAAVRAQTTITDGAIVTVPGTYPSPWSTGTLVVGTPLNSGTLIIQNGGSVISLASLTLQQSKWLVELAV